MQIVVKESDEPVAQIGPPSVAAVSWRDRMAREGRLRIGTQAWDKLTISKTARPVNIQSALGAVHEDPSEVRRR